jgi:hypothetical protein
MIEERCGDTCTRFETLNDLINIQRHFKYSIIVFTVVQRMSSGGEKKISTLSNHFENFNISMMTGPIKEQIVFTFTTAKVNIQSGVKPKISLLYSKMTNAFVKNGQIGVTCNLDWVNHDVIIL